MGIEPTIPAWKAGVLLFSFYYLVIRSNDIDLGWQSGSI